jgi:nitrate reductase (cytochrome), electron transfer subunit
VSNRADRRGTTRQEPTLSPGVQLALAGVIVLAFIGFFVGIQQGEWVADPIPPFPYPDVVRQDGGADSISVEEVVTAMAYADFDRRQYGPNRNWRGSLAALPTLPQVFDSTDTVATDTEAAERDGDGLSDLQIAEQRAVALVARASRRAFEGAPPVVPHPIDPMGTASCLACHADGRHIGRGVTAPKMSHGHLANCTQCHVEQRSPDLEQDDGLGNRFHGHRGFGKGSRAWPGAPPAIPHTILMRESCLSCHGPGGHEPLRTSHPVRTNCLQCHAPSAYLDQQSAKQSR